MLPLNISTCLTNRPWLDKIIQKINPDTADKILELYAPALDIVKPSVYEKVFDSDWHSRDHKIIPRSFEKEYLTLSQNYNVNAGESWPTFDDFFNDNMADVEPFVIKEIAEQFTFFETRDKIKEVVRADQHPTPIEHLEYLTAVGIPVSSDAVKFAKHWEKLVMTNQCTWKNKKVKRF